VKVVEGSEIYNFHFHHSVHFSCKDSSYGQSNRGSLKSSCRPRRAGAGAVPPRARPRLGRPPASPSEPHRAPPEAASFPGRPRPKTPRVPRHASRRRTAVLCQVRRRPLRAHWPRQVTVRGVMSALTSTHHRGAAPATNAAACRDPRSRTSCRPLGTPWSSTCPSNALA
jgi:hypothetical protein